jgi:long-chain fatty acid transport protein
MSIWVRSCLGAAALSAGALGSLPASATNGYFAHGYGVKAEGEAGAGIAFPQDSLTIATNPAGLVAVADGFDAGLDVFRPRREATLVQAGVAETFDGNDTGTFYIPSLGYSRHLNPHLALGIALFGNGGLQTNYGSNPFARFGATGSAGVGLQQAFLAPAVAYEVAAGQTIGLALNVGYQKFAAKGLGLFAAFSSDPSNVSDRGDDTAFGAGARLGWIGHLNQYMAVGATWQSKTYFEKFKKYAGLFADHGGFDAPPTYGVGAALTPTGAWTIALDWQRIEYSKIASVGNSVASLFAGVPLGADNGPGFGWRDMSVAKLGVTYRAGEQWTVRAGVSHGRQPIPASETFFNILAPGVVETHLTAGLSWKPSGADEFSLGVVHAPKHTVNGAGSIPPAFGGGEVNVSLAETSIGFSWSHRR